MVNKIKLLLILFTLSLNLSSQQYNSWLFGNLNYLKFNPNPTIIAGSVMNTNEGCASISDNLGNLLFYSDGVKVWGRNHIQMPNGFGLLGDNSTTQSCIITAQPGVSGIYYIFTAPESIAPNNVCYSIVNMSLNGGFGDVTVKNQTIFTIPSSTEKLTECIHANGVDKWIILHERNTNIFWAVRLSSGGIVQWTASNVGTVVTNNLGQMKVSPMRNKLACCWYGQNKFCTYDFNNATGQVTNETLLSTDVGPYGCEFSGSGQYLYLSFNNGNKLYQFNVCDNSKITIASTLGNFMGALQYAPDGKIYLAQRLNTRLHVINNPDLLGLSCNLVLNQTITGGVVSFGLPHGVHPCPQPVLNTYLYTLNCNNFTANSPLQGCLYNNIPHTWTINGIYYSNTNNIVAMLNSNQIYDITLTIQFPCFTYILTNIIDTSLSYNTNIYSN